MNPDIWGPHAWYFLHAVAEAYPNDPTESDMEHYYTFFSTLRYTLPCPVCREHLKKVMEKTPIPLDSREQLRRWVIDIHNLVNQDLGRLEVDYEEAPFSMYTIPPTISVSLFRICVVLCSAFLLHFVFQEAL